jgi:hypothetical protein
LFFTILIENKNSILARSNFSSKNVARTVWEWSEWGGENWKLAVIGREVWNSLSYWSINPFGDVTRQAKTLSHQKEADISVVLNSPYTKRTFIMNCTVLIQPQSVKV